MEEELLRSGGVSIAHLYAYAPFIQYGRWYTHPSFLWARDGNVFCDALSFGAVSAEHVLSSSVALQARAVPVSPPRPLLWDLFLHSLLSFL